MLEPTYMNGKGVVQIGNVVTTPDNVRAVVIGTDGSFVRVHGFGTHRETGDIVVLNWVHDLPASECVLLDPYAVKLLGGLRNERRRCQESQARAAPGPRCLYSVEKLSKVCKIGVQPMLRPSLTVSIHA